MKSSFEEDDDPTPCIDCGKEIDEFEIYCDECEAKAIAESEENNF